MNTTIKPNKPRRDFPLTAHASGKWCKKIRGRVHYFGTWADPDGAERDYDRVKNDLREGRKPNSFAPDTVTVRELSETFLVRKLAQVDAKQLKPRSYQDYVVDLRKFAKAVGPTRLVSDLRPDDFAHFRHSTAKNLGAHALNRCLQNIRAALKHATANGLVTKVVAMGDGFAKAPVSQMRKASREKTYTHGTKVFTPEEIKCILAAAPSPLKAMILLALNTGLYAEDVSQLPQAAINLDTGWLEFPRTKTEVMRCAHLWPETINAVKQAMETRPKAKREEDAGLVFLTKYGNRWVHDKVHRGSEGITSVSHSDAIAHDFADLLDMLKIRRTNRGFSAMRKTFRTAAEETGQRNAVLLMMGHAFIGMDEWYVMSISKGVMVQVSMHVRKALLQAE